MPIGRNQWLNKEQNIGCLFNIIASLFVFGKKGEKNNLFWQVTAATDNSNRGQVYSWCLSFLLSCRQLISLFFWFQFYCVNSTAAGVAAAAGFTEVCFQSSEGHASSQPGGQFSPSLNRFPLCNITTLLLHFIMRLIQVEHKCSWAELNQNVFNFHRAQTQVDRSNGPS